MEKLLQWLDGKKAVIGNILQVVNSICVSTGLYSAEIGIALATLILAVTGVAIQQTNKILGRRNRLQR